MSTPTMKRLYKSRSIRMIDGVCGGVAEYFGVDPTLVRIAWLLLAFMGGMGILLYLAAMIIMPKSPNVVPPAAGSGDKNAKFWGLLLVVVGSIWLLSNLGISIWWHWWDLPWGIVFSVLLIMAGAAFLMGGRNGLHTTAEPAGEAAESSPAAPKPVPRLEKSRTDKKVFGVCGGIGQHLGIDPTIVRFAFVVGGIASFGLALLIYVVLAIFVPTENIAPVTA